MTLEFEPTEEPRPSTYAIAVYTQDGTGLGVIEDGFANEQEADARAAELRVEWPIYYTFSVWYEEEPVFGMEGEYDRYLVAPSLLRRRAARK